MRQPKEEDFVLGITLESKPKKRNYKSITYPFSEDEYHDLKRRAEKEGWTILATLRQAVKEFVQ